MSDTPPPRDRPGPPAFEVPPDAAGAPPLDTAGAPPLDTAGAPPPDAGGAPGSARGQAESPVWTPPPTVTAPPAGSTWGPPPAPPRQPEVPGAPGRYFAATITRVAAFFIDTIVIAILGLVVGGIIGGVGGAVSPGVLSSGAFRILGGLAGIATSFLYFGLLWRSSGKATVGQRIFRMQVGNAFDGAILTWEQVVIRWLILFGFGVVATLPVVGTLGELAGLIWAIVLLVTTASSLTKQGLHDQWADSAVVATGPQNTTLAWGCLIAYAVLAVLLVALALIALGAFYAGASTTL